MDQIVEWKALSRDTLQTAYDIFATASVPATKKGYRDEKFLALTLLARTISNFKSALLLIDNKRVIEARILVRTCLENSYRVERLAAEGERFARLMLNDDMSRRRSRAQRLLDDPSIRLEDGIKEKLTGWMKESAKRFENAKSLTPGEITLKGVLAGSYIFYEQLSSDAAHPSVDALNRHVIPHTSEEVGGVDVDPVPRDAEIIETLEYLCMAAIGVLVGVDQIIGGTEGGKVMSNLADPYKSLSDQYAAQRITLRAHERRDQ